jgi:hypothetical protein
MRTTITFTALLLSALAIGQTINLESTTTPGQFQDADVGSMALADIDDDEDLDLLITGKGGPVKTTLYRNDGSGNFTEIADVPFVNVYSGTVGFGDVDGDEDLDILITGSTSSPTRTANLYLNDGMGNYSLVANTPFPASVSGDFAFGDVDDDEDLDVLITGYNTADTGFTTLFLNDGSGSFSEAAATPFAAVWDSAVEFIDVDDDEDLDVILAGMDNDDQPSTTMYLNDGVGTFNLVENTPFDDCSGGDVAVGDIDGDDDLDILLCGKNNAGEIVSKLYLNDATGTFSLLADTPFPGTLLGATAFADFDNDDDLDVFLLGTGPGGLADNSIIGNIYENLGANNYALADSLNGGYFSSVAIGDVDGDDDLDLFLAGTTTGSPTRGTKLYTNLTTVSVNNGDQIPSASVLIYPNPSDGRLNIEFEQPTAYTATVMSLTGQLMYTKQQPAESRASLRLDLPTGIYLLSIKTKEGSATRKLILENP